MNTTMNMELPVLLILHLVEKKCGCIGSVGVFYPFWYTVFIVTTAILDIPVISK